MDGGDDGGDDGGREVHVWMDVCMGRCRWMDGCDVIMSSHHRHHLSTRPDSCGCDPHRSIVVVVVVVVDVVDAFVSIVQSFLSGSNLLLI